MKVYMRKVVSTIILILVLIIVHLLQFTVFKKFTMFNILANILIIYFVFLSTYTNKILSYILALFYGFFVDIGYGNPIGITSFAIILIIELTTRLNLLLYVNSRIATMIKIFFLTIIFEFTRHLLRVVILSFNIEIIEFLKIVSVEALYNMLILMVIYPLFKYGGELTDAIFNKKNILTRYF